jgi:ribosomal protein S18 acetylase RimI-like enzyme
VKISVTKDIIFRPPKLTDSIAATDFINSLVQEQAMILCNVKVTLRKEKIWLSSLMEQIRRKQAVALVADNKGLCGICTIKRGIGASSHVGILDISVSKELRRKGIGKKLLKLTIREAEAQMATKIVKLEVMAVNKPAINLYGSVDFLEIGRIKKAAFYRAKYHDVILMVKYLK